MDLICTGGKCEVFRFLNGLFIFYGKKERMAIDCIRTGKRRNSAVLLKVPNKCTFHPRSTNAEELPDMRSIIY